MKRSVRSQVLKAASMKPAVFCILAPCSLARFTDVSEVLAACHHQDDETAQRQ
jgi:hypothetical protein